MGILIVTLDGTGANHVSTAAFDAWGNRTTTDASGDPYRGFGSQFGYYTDNETGLQLLGHRYYNSTTGRFVTRDPIGIAGGFNVYAYVGNRGPNGVDPLGLSILPIPEWLEGVVGEVPLALEGGAILVIGYVGIKKLIETWSDWEIARIKHESVRNEKRLFDEWYYGRGYECLNPENEVVQVYFSHLKQWDIGFFRFVVKDVVPAVNKVR